MKWLAKPILWLLTFAIPVFIAACYGCPNGECGPGDEGEGAFITGKVVNPAGQGIPNIQISCMTGDADAGASAGVTVYSMADDGGYSLEQPSSGCSFLRFEDVDGAENGSFQSVDAPVNGATEINVVMDEAE